MAVWRGTVAWFIGFLKGSHGYGGLTERVFDTVFDTVSSG